MSIIGKLARQKKLLRSVASANEMRSTLERSVKAFGDNLKEIVNEIKLGKEIKGECDICKSLDL